MRVKFYTAAGEQFIYLISNNYGKQTPFETDGLYQDTAGNSTSSSAFNENGGGMEMPVLPSQISDEKEGGKKQDKAGQTQELAGEQTTEQTEGQVPEQTGEQAEEQTEGQADKNQSKESNIQQGEPGKLPSTGSEPGNTMSNLINGGVLASDGVYKYVMVSNLLYNKHNLVRISTNTQEYQKLTDNRGYFMNIVGDWIYYVERLEKDPYYGGIARLRKDGSGKEKLFSGSSIGMVIIGETIYFINASDDFKIYSMDTNGENLKLIIDRNVSQLQYQDGYLYFTSYSGTTDLYRVNTSTFEQPAKTAEDVKRFIVYKNSIYYLTFI